MHGRYPVCHLSVWTKRTTFAGSFSPSSSFTSVHVKVSDSPKRHARSFSSFVFFNKYHGLFKKSMKFMKASASGSWQSRFCSKRDTVTVRSGNCFTAHSNVWKTFMHDKNTVWCSWPINNSTYKTLSVYVYEDLLCNFNLYKDIETKMYFLKWFFLSIIVDVI